MKGAKLKAIATMMVSAIVAAAPTLANACATCGLSDGSPAFQAYKTSALFLVASPYVSFAAIGVSPSSTWLCLLGGSHRLSRVPNKACRSRGGVRANSRAVPGCVSLGA